MMNVLMGLIMMYSFETGIIPKAGFQFIDYAADNKYYSIKSGLPMFFDFDVKFGKNINRNHFVSLGGNINTTVGFNPHHQFVPLNELYGLKFSYKYKKRIEVQFTHDCTHPIYTYIVDPSILNHRFEGSYEKLSITFNGSLNIFK